MHVSSRASCTPLKVAVDARNLAHDHRGLGRYARALLRRFVQRDDIAVTLVVDRPWPGLVKRRFAKMLGSARFDVASRIHESLVWHPWNGIFLNGGRTHICTIADLTPFKFPAEDPIRRLHEQSPFITAVARANRIITFSHASKDDLATMLHVPVNAVSVTYLGVDDSFEPADRVREVQPNQSYFLFIGDPAEPRKNFELLYRAFRRAWPNCNGPHLAVLSQRDPALPGVRHLKSDTEDVEGKENVRLRALYRGAIATAVPSLYEGFGMPVSESMACGTPVIAARASSLPEIAGEAALLEDPADEEAWANALGRVASDPSLRITLRELGLQNVKRFRWDACAAQTQAVFEEVAALARSMP